MTQQVVVITRESGPAIRCYVEAASPKAGVANLMQQLWERGYVIITTTDGVSMAINKNDVMTMLSE